MRLKTIPGRSRFSSFLTALALTFVAIAIAITGVAGVAVAAPAPPPAPRAPDLPRGTLVERVVCAGHPEQAYALYLPKSYTPERRWPILYAFDASSQGRSVAALFQGAAERYGWIVVSSWNTASDGPMEPNFKAMSALWADTHARFAIDESRVYAAGFSGTVRFSCILALTARERFAASSGQAPVFLSGRRRKRAIRSTSSARWATVISITTR